MSPKDALKYEMPEAGYKLFLQLYMVVVALALSEGITRCLMDEDGKLQPLRDIARSAPQLLALIAVVVPFFHGVWRHFEKTYRPPLRRGTAFLLIADFSFLCIQATVLYAMGIGLEEPSRFYGTLCVLLGMDVLYGLGFFAYFWRTTGRALTSHLTWCLLNFLTLLVILGFFGMTPVGESLTVAILLAAITILRTVLDYLFLMDFYFEVGAADATPRSGESSS